MSIVKGHLLPSKRAPFTHQKSTFCVVKDALLQCKRPSLTFQMWNNFT